MPKNILKFSKMFTRLSSVVWNLLLLVSSDKAIKLLKELLYSDSNRNPSAQDSALKCSSPSLRQGNLCLVSFIYFWLGAVQRPVKKLNELARLYWW